MAEAQMVKTDHPSRQCRPAWLKADQALPHPKIEKQTQTNPLTLNPSFSDGSPEKRKNKPIDIKSIPFNDLGPFWGRILHFLNESRRRAINDSEKGKTNPNKPIGLNSMPFNYLSRNWQKQTHGVQLSCFEAVRPHFGPILHFLNGSGIVPSMIRHGGIRATGSIRRPNLPCALFQLAGLG
jgi:hypothetical protein